MKVIPIIPALNPDDKLIKLVNELKKEFKVINQKSKIIYKMKYKILKFNDLYFLYFFKFF